MTERDRRQVFHPEREDTPGAIPYDVLLGGRTTLMFLYLGVTEHDADFGAVLGSAVRRAERGRGNYLSDFDFTVRTQPYDALRERLTNLSEEDRATLGEAADVLQGITDAEESYEVETLIESLAGMLEADDEWKRGDVSPGEWTAEEIGEEIPDDLAGDTDDADERDSKAE